jgi:hypothetical protein
VAAFTDEHDLASRAVAPGPGDDGMKQLARDHLTIVGVWCGCDEPRPIARRHSPGLALGVGGIALAGSYFAALPVLRRERRQRKAERKADGQ